MKVRLQSIYEKVSNPLFIMATSNYIGDACIIASGHDYGNPLRIGAALIGALAGTSGIFQNKEGQFLGLDARNFAMQNIRIGAFGFIASGSNIFGYEDSARLTEIFVGSSLVIATTLNLNDRPKLGSAFFFATNFFMAGQTIETFVKTGEADLKMLGAVSAFTVGNIATFFMKREEVNNNNLESHIK